MILHFWRYVIPDAIHYTEKPPFFRHELTRDDAQSVVWCERYYEPGSFSAVFPATPELIQFFWNLDIMVTRAETDRVMLVENLEVYNTDAGDFIRISGPSGEGLTARRIIMQRGQVTLNAVTAIIYYIRENLGAYWYDESDDEHPHGVSYPQCRRFVNVFDAGGWIIIPDTITAEPFGRNLSEFITEICKGVNLGFRVIFDGEKLRYQCYRGEDRTLKQSDRDPVIFADDLHNIGQYTYTRSLEGYRSHVIAGGSGTGTSRSYNEAYSSFRAVTGAGANMVEGFISSSGTSDSALRYVAQNALLASRKTAEFDTAYAVSGGQYTYRTDYDLGDRVSVQNRLGISGTATVTEVVETEDETGFYVVPKLAEFADGDVVVPDRPDRAVYRRLEYIATHGDGGEYIVSDIVPDYTMRAEITVSFGAPNYSITDGNDGMLFGYRGSDGAFSIALSGGLYMLGYENIEFMYAFSWYAGITYDYVIYQTNVMGMCTGKLNRGTCYWNSATAVADKEQSSAEPSTGMVIFGGRISGGTIKPMLRSPMRLYSLTLFRGDVPVHELVPVERQGDGVAGLLDLQTRKFYENAGSGEFIKGGYADETV